MKLKFKGIIEAERLDGGDFIVTAGDGYFYRGHEVILKDDLKYFTPANCEAVILMEKTEGAHETTSFSCPYCHAPDRSGETWDQCGRLF